MNASFFLYFFKLESDIPAGLGVQHFSSVHVAWLASVFFCCAGTVLLFLRANQRRRQHIICGVAVTMLLIELLRDLWLVTAGQFDVRFMLPLHLCGIMLFVELAAAFTRHPLLCELSYCLGMPGALFALLTPDSTVYPLLNLYYLCFIASHALLLILPIMLLLDGFRPTPRRLPACAGALAVTIWLVWLCNRQLNANYLFLNAAPVGSVLEIIFSFSQPFYLLGTLGLLTIVWVLMYLPWCLHRKRITVT